MVNSRIRVKSLAKHRVPSKGSDQASKVSD